MTERTKTILVLMATGWAVWILMSILLGCAEESVYCIPTDEDAYELYIDAECLPRERAAIMDGIDRLNELVCEPLVELVGSVVVNHDGEDMGTEVDAVACYYGEPEWYDGSRYESKLGWSDYYQNVRLFTFRNPGMADNYALAIAMHELGHYVGIGHAADKRAVMYPAIGPLNIEYTAVDRRLLEGTR